MWIVLIIPALGLLALVYGLLIGAIVIPAWAMWVCGAVVVLFVLSQIVGRNQPDTESEYHTAQQALCNRRKQIVEGALGRPSKSMTPAEQREYDSLIAKSQDLFVNGLVEEKPAPAPRGKVAKVRR